MFFNSDLLTKRGALAQVWMASHLTSKLSKQALTSTSIPKSVQSILGQDLLPMALRLSGQLLLGIARIYSRKTKYLLDDAQETLVKVKKAFQNEGRGAVDLPDDIGGGVAGEERGGRDINLRRDGGDLEDLFAGEFADGEWNLEKHLAAAAAVKAKAAAGGAKGKQKALTANLADITLDESFTHDYSSNFGGLDNGLGDGFDDLGLDLGFGGEEGFDPDFALFEDDAELNALANPDGAAATKKRSKKRSRNGEDDGEGSERSEDDQSVEMGRDAVHHASSERGSIGPFDLDLGLGKDANGDVSMDFGAPEEYGGGFDDVGLDMGFDNNNEFGGGFDEPLLGGDREKTPTAAGSAAGDDLSSLHLTPRAAAEIAARAAQQAKDAEKAGDPAKKRQKALAVDKVIELDWEAGRLEGKERFKDPEFLPASRVHLALLAANSTSAHLPRALPKESKNALALESFAPPGLLAPELQELFKMPTRREQIKLEGRERDKAAEKEGADKDVELGRRAMSVISNVRGGSVIGDGAENPFGEFDLNQDFGGGFDEAPAGGEEYGGGFDGGEFQLDLELDAGIADEQGDVFKTPTKANRASKKQKTSHDVGSREPSIFEGEGTPAPSSLFKDDLPQYRSEGPLAVFDDVSSASTVAGSVAESQSQSQPQAATASQSLGTTEEGDAAESMVEQKTGTVSLRSKNTRKAVGVLKSELLEKENETGVETLEFGKVAEKASRRAAASFFFELLVLSSADVVKLRQPTAYGEIEVKATEKLREMVA